MFCLEYKDVIEKLKIKKHDTGSSAAQIILLTYRIQSLTSHFRKAPKDYSSKLGFIKMIEKRKKLLKYLKRQNNNMYISVTKVLGLRK
jgi:small subunit ribosomal protein S15